MFELPLIPFRNQFGRIVASSSSSPRSNQALWFVQEDRAHHHFRTRTHGLKLSRRDFSRFRRRAAEHSSGDGVCLCVEG